MGFHNTILFLNRRNTACNEFKPHKHNCCEIIYFVSGTGNMVIDDRRFPVSPGTYCIVPPEVTHFEKLEGYGEIFFIGFNYQSILEKIEIGVHQSKDASTIVLFEKILDEYNRQDLGYELAAQSLLNLLLVASIRDTGESDKKCKDLNYIKSYIDQYFNQKINFEQLATMSGYSRDYFRSVFKSKFNLSPRDYLIHTRMEKAKEMLLKTDFSCTEIAYACGFTNSAQMTVMFKKKYGKTPKSFKTTD